ncbi:hypothetical protein Bca52824_051573 [Brassica carinata]|uniref:HTH myb-type domain-containing protein n=1 Tax=Brassica carinata TaxID=52824 RepID=A0A8X7R5M7_BRACI|nr:hypothetical protein Bca52824_051573 [Brassica carinata]
MQQRSPLTESHMSAYCWTAAECTLRFMWPSSASDGVFTDAVERIWTKRIGILKESGSGLRIREINVRYTVVSFLTQLVKEQWGLLGSSTLESVAQRRFLKRKAENNVESDRPNDVYENTERLESDTIDDANERRGSGEGETGNGDNMDVEGVGCLENDGIDKVIEQHGAEEERTMGAQEQEHESSLDKGCGLIGKQQDNASEKSSGSQRTCSGRVRPRLPSPVSSVRRRKKFWTPEEVEALREGVKEYGKSWKNIKNANPVVFAERTEVSMSFCLHSFSSFV